MLAHIMEQPIQRETRTYDGTAHLTESEYHQLLASKRRRTVLDIFATESLPIGFHELAAEVAKREHDADAVEKATIDRVRLHLHHTHLPKMASLDVVEYDPETARVDTP